jgi:hypothetical protein
MFWKKRNVSAGLLGRSLEAAGLSLATVLLTSCSSGPARVNQPSINASAAGDAAIDEYDTDQDGVIAGAELDKVPAFKSALAQLDTNNDGGVSADEVSAMIEHWQAMPLGIMSMGFKLTLDGTLVEDATVTFEPEAFLGDDIKTATAITDSFGTGGPSVPKEQRQDVTTPPGVQMGFYRIKVSKMVNGKEMIPAKYNENTILGQLIVPDEPEIFNRRVVYAMTTK